MMHEHDLLQKLKFDIGVQCVVHGPYVVFRRPSHPKKSVVGFGERRTCIGDVQHGN